MMAEPHGPLAAAVMASFLAAASRTAVAGHQPAGRPPAGKKQPRNAPCCCGSGTKAKRCCVTFPQR